jgi:hypothetical protein
MTDLMARPPPTRQRSAHDALYSSSIYTRRMVRERRKLASATHSQTWRVCRGPTGQRRVADPRDVDVSRVGQARRTRQPRAVLGLAARLCDAPRHHGCCGLRSVADQGRARPVGPVLQHRFVVHGRLTPRGAVGHGHVACCCLRRALCVWLYSRSASADRPNQDGHQRSSSRRETAASPWNRTRSSAARRSRAERSRRVQKLTIATPPAET